MPRYVAPTAFASASRRRIVAQLLVARQHALHAQAVLADQRLELGGRLARYQSAALDVFEAPVLARASACPARPCPSGGAACTAPGPRTPGNLCRRGSAPAVRETNGNARRRRRRPAGIDGGRQWHGQIIATLSATAECKVPSWNWRNSPCRSSTKERKPRVLAEGPGRQDAQPEGLRGQARGALLLSEGRHAGLHDRGVQLPRRAAGLLESQGDGPRRERARHAPARRSSRRSTR